MYEWLSENSSIIQVFVSAVTALVWVIYLQLLFTNFRRQQRTEILINLGGSNGLAARCIISNLGFEPIYILEGLLTIQSADGPRVASIIDRTETVEKDLNTPTEGTLQGPLRSGHFVDLGSLENIVDRARTNQFENIDIAEIESFEIKIAAVTAARSHIVAARREFVISLKDDGPDVRPVSLSSHQIRSWWGRRKLRNELAARLKQHAGRA